MAPDLNTTLTEDDNTPETHLEIEAILLELLPGLADTVGGLLRQRSLSKSERPLARSLLRRAFTWEQPPISDVDPDAEPNAESDAEPDPVRNLDEGLSVVRGLDRIARATHDRERLWVQRLETKLNSLWPISVNCCKPGNWDLAFAVYVSDQMAKERLQRVKGVLDTMQVQLDHLDDSEESQEAKIRRAMGQNRAHLPLVEG